MNIAVVGATGQVGGVIRALLIERCFPVKKIRFFASSRSAGSTISWQDHQIIVEDVENANWNGVDIALVSAGKEASLEYADSITSTGAVVVDNSSGWRMDPEVPLVVPEVNAVELNNIPKGIVANPNCTTMVAMPVLAPLHTESGLISLTVSTYQAVSGAGLAGVEELSNQVEFASREASSLTHNGQAINFGEPKSFPKAIAFNVLPQAGKFVDDGRNETDEEQKLRNETKKILNIPDLAVSSTCVRVPVFTGHSLTINAQFSRELTPSRAKEILTTSPGVKIVDLPTPIEAVGGDTTLVGRIRQDETVENGLSLFISGDNLRKGAALNAIQIAEELIKRRF